MLLEEWRQSMDKQISLKLSVIKPRVSLYSEAFQMGLPLIDRVVIPVS